MARVAGVDLPRNKRMEYALTYINGLRAADAIDVRKRKFHTLVSWEINSCYACHRLGIPFLNFYPLSPAAVCGGHSRK